MPVSGPARPARIRGCGFRLAVLAGALTVASGALAACGTSGSGTPGSSATTTATAASYPVTVTNCGVPVSYDHAPKRAVSNDINTTEDMLALGLESRMVGDFGVTGDGPVSKPVPDRYLAGFRAVPAVSPDYFTLEKLVGVHPDFLFAGWNYGLQADTTLTPDNLAHYGIKTLVLNESCVHVQPGKSGASIDDTYQDLRNLGVIFGVQQRASKVIAAMRAQVASVRVTVGSLKPVTVFDYDSGQAAPFTGPGLAMPNALISMAGGINIFGSLKRSWTSVSWEQVVKADPQCIIINDYGTPTAQQKEKFLETNEVTRKITAVRNQCFLALSYDEVTPGPRNAEAVVALARWLHPGAYGLSAVERAYPRSAG